MDSSIKMKKEKNLQMFLKVQMLHQKQIKNLPLISIVKECKEYKIY